MSNKGKLDFKLSMVFLQVVLVALSLAIVVQTDICPLAKGSQIQSTNLSAGYVKNSSDVVSAISAGVWIAPDGNVSLDDSEILLALRDPARTLRIVVDTESAVEMGYIGTAEGVLILWPDITNTLRSIAPYDYRERPWYLKVNESGQTTWTKPYLEANTGSLAITCATPIYQNNELLGVAGMDVSLASLQRDMSLYDAKYLFLVNDEGIVVTRSEPVPQGFLWDELLSLGTISGVEKKPVSLLDSKNSQLIEIGQKMLSGGTGVSVIRLNKGDCQIAYAPLKSIGWSLGLVWGDLDLATAKAAQYDEFFQRIADQNEIVARSAAEHLSEGPSAFEGLQLQSEDAQSEDTSLLGTNLLAIGALFLIGIILAGALGLRVGKNSMRPLDPLFEAFERVGRGEFNSISFDSSYNRDELNDAFSRMTANLKQNISKLENEALKKGRAQKDSEIMGDVSKALQPQKFPHIEGYDMAYFSAELDWVSFYDAFELDDGNVVLLMADVSGEGFSAAMQAYLIKTLIKTHSRKYQDPADILKEINQHINEISRNGMMTTCFCGILDPFADVMEYANAGHAFPFVISSQGSVDTLTGGGIALGALDHINLQSDSISVNPGDVLVIYDDRLPEITNEWKEPFGTERLITLMKDNMGDSASGMTTTIEKAIRVHAGNHGPIRNCSLIIVKKNP